MIPVLKANEMLFQTGWFVESLSTQVLVIFISRTRGNPFKSRAHPILVATSIAVVVNRSHTAIHLFGSLFWLRSAARPVLCLSG
jgi:hypothetical protein